MVQTQVVRHRFETASTWPDKRDALREWVALYNSGVIDRDTLHSISGKPVRERDGTFGQAVVDDAPPALFIAVTASGAMVMSEDPLPPPDMMRAPVSWPTLSKK